MQHLKTTITKAFDNISELSPSSVTTEISDAVNETIHQLDQGKVRVCEQTKDGWEVHQWIKKAILIFFRIHNNVVLDNGVTQFFDKVPLKFSKEQNPNFNELNVRVVPPAFVRKGSFVAANTVLMPSYVNIGAYIDSGTMVDTWATVGSCAQIGKNVHLSGGVGIGGVLEPLQANPTIIEDNCFIGARSEIVEGVVVEKNSVISMGVFIGQSTPIYNRDTDEIIYGRVPSGSVVIPGNLPAKNGKYSCYCALIMKQVDEKTRSKTSINELLRSD